MATYTVTTLDATSDDFDGDLLLARGAGPGQRRRRTADSIEFDQTAMGGNTIVSERQRVDHPHRTSPSTAARRHYRCRRAQPGAVVRR